MGNMLLSEREVVARHGVSAVVSITPHVVSSEGRFWREEDMPEPATPPRRQRRARTRERKDRGVSRPAD